MSLEGQWKSKKFQTKLTKEDDLFTEILVEDSDLLDHKESIQVDTTSLLANNNIPVNSLSYNISDEDSQMCKKGPYRIPPDLIKVKRIKRPMSQHLMLTARSLASIILSAPILLYFVTIATYRTAKTHVLDTYYYKKKRAQDNEEEITVKELLTQNEIYYANQWGYTSEMHQAVTEDGYILSMYRISKKGTNPQGIYLLCSSCTYYQYVSLKMDFCCIKL